MRRSICGLVMIGAVVWAGTGWAAEFAKLVDPFFDAEFAMKPTMATAEARSGCCRVNTGNYARGAGREGSPPGRR